ncbi:MAG: thioredoxin family protein [Candidatus Heimdallarchaeota archaeon]
MDVNRFKQGFTWEKYLKHLDANLEKLKNEEEKAEEYVQAFHERFKRVLMTEDEIKFITSIQSKVNVVALAEYWCSDAQANLSVMARIAELNPNIELRIFPRDANLDLMNQYLFRGKSMSIPAFGFFDENFQEFGRWLGGKPKIMWDLIDEIGLEAAIPKVMEFNIENSGQEALKEFIEILRSM